MTGRWGDWYHDHRRPIAAAAIGVAILLVIVAVAVGAALLRDDGPGVAEPTAASSATTSAAPSTSEDAPGQPSAPSPTSSLAASASAVPEIPPADPEAVAEGWTEVARFGGSDTIETVLDIADTPYGVLAVGVRIGTVNLPVFGPVPQDGRVWRSEDGQSWQDVTPAGTFADAWIRQVVALPDGAVVAFGTVSVLEEGIPDDEPTVWETRDGRTWTRAVLAMDGQPVTGVAHGARGYVAVRGDAEGQELWHAADGRTFSRAFALPLGSAVMSLAGGPEGFVAIVADTAAEYASSIYASGDGVDWYEAEGGPAEVRAVAALGPDWVAVAPGPFEDYSVRADTPAWLSANGLDWTETGAIPLIAVALDESTSCREFILDAIGTGGEVIVSTTFSYPCGEGRVQNFGRSSISSDGARWSRLPFTESSVAVDRATRGATVTSGIELETGTILVGEKDYRASFWWLPADR